MRKFTCQFRKHDAHHLEIKTNLPIPEKGRARFDLNFYIFSPAQLNINKDNFSRKKVLKQIRVNTRFSSPALSLSSLVDTEYGLSPICRIQGYLEKVGTVKTAKDKKVIHELQTLVNAFRSNIKGFIDLAAELTGSGNAALNPYKDQIAQVIEQTEMLMQQVRDLYPAFLQPQVSATLRTALEWSDESISLLAERKFMELRSICGTCEQLDTEIDLLNRSIAKIAQYRLERQYASVYTGDQEVAGEKVAYRESILKKWSQSALYMQAAESRLPKRVEHIMAGTAAALAMTFAVLAAAYADIFFVRNTAPWALIIIISYVFKDRIKEVLRGILSRLMPRLLADRIIRLKDPESLADAAATKEIVSYGKDYSQPEHIKAARDYTSNPFYSILPPQDVLHYNRIIRLNSKLLKSHKRLESLTEIIRLRIDEWLKSMDDPEESFNTMINGKQVEVSNERVYHIHLIASLREYRKGASPGLFHYCLIMNRNGLVRIEER